MYVYIYIYMHILPLTYILSLIYEKKIYERKYMKRNIHIREYICIYIHLLISLMKYVYYNSYSFKIFKFFREWKNFTFSQNSTSSTKFQLFVNIVGPKILIFQKVWDSSFLALFKLCRLWYFLCIFMHYICASKYLKCT